MAEKSQDSSEDRKDENSNTTENEGGTSIADASPVPPTAIGWAVRVVSLVLIVGLIGYLAYKAINEDGRFDYTIEAKWDEAQPGRNNDYLVPLEITNKSSRAIRNLQIELSQGDSEPIDLNVMLVGPNETMTYVVELGELEVPVDTHVVYYEK